MSIILNILWFILGGFLIALPFAAQHLKMTRLAILPFGFRVVETR
jgi:uncharacterized membrane protein YccF (DUF307 family)